MKNLELILGLYDDPENQEQDIYSIDLYTSNLAIFGNAMSGKTTLIKTLLIRMHQCITTDDEEEIYILDFSNDLELYKDLPYIRAYFDVFSEENIRRIFKVVNEKLAFNIKELPGKNFTQRSPESEAKHITFILDGIHALFSDEKYTQYQEELLRIARDGLSKGVSVVFSATEPIGGIKRLLSSCSRTIAFDVKKDFYSDIFSVKVTKPMILKGRGIANKEEKCYEFQAFFPYNSDIVENSEERNIREVINKLRNEYYVDIEYLQSLKLKGLSGVLDFEAWKTYTNEPSKVDNVLVAGLDYYQCKPVKVNLLEAKTIAIYGKKQFGKTNLLKLILEALTQKDEMRIVYWDDSRRAITDNERGILSYIEQFKEKVEISDEEELVSFINNHFLMNNSTYKIPRNVDKDEDDIYTSYDFDSNINDDQITKNKSYPLHLKRDPHVSVKYDTNIEDELLLDKDLDNFNILNSKYLENNAEKEPEIDQEKEKLQSEQVENDEAKNFDDEMNFVDRTDEIDDIDVQEDEDESNIEIDQEETDDESLENMMGFGTDLDKINDFNDFYHLKNETEEEPEIDQEKEKLQSEQVENDEAKNFNDEMNFVDRTDEIDDIDVQEDEDESNIEIDQEETDDESLENMMGFGTDLDKINDFNDFYHLKNETEEEPEIDQEEEKLQFEQVENDEAKNFNDEMNFVDRTDEIDDIDVQEDEDESNIEIDQEETDDESLENMMGFGTDLDKINDFNDFYHLKNETEEEPEIDQEKEKLQSGQIENDEAKNFDDKYNHKNKINQGYERNSEALNYYMRDNNRSRNFISKSYMGIPNSTNKKTKNKLTQKSNPELFTVFIIQSRLYFSKKNGRNGKHIIARLSRFLEDCENVLFVFSDVQKIADSEIRTYFNNNIRHAFLLDDILKFINGRGNTSVFNEYDLDELKENFARSHLGDGFYYNVEFDEIQKVKMLKMEE